MCKIVNFLTTMLIIISLVTNVVFAVDYTDIKQIDILSSDASYYSHEDRFDTTENLQYRAGSYGYAM